MKRNQPKSGLQWRSGSQIQPVRPADWTQLDALGARKGSEWIGLGD